LKHNWHQDGACNGHPDPDLWHYENSVYVDEQQLTVLRTVEAIEICHQCPVRAQCLQQGLESENIISVGGVGSVWGGLLTGERALLAGLSTNHNSVRHEVRHRRDVRRKIGKIKV
jgi:hypothetical protein